MKSEFVNYLEEVGITDLFQDKAKEAYLFYEKLYPDSILDIFVSEYINPEGKQQYENLWFFTESLFMEAKKFLTEDDFDATSIIKKIRYWEIWKKDYDFESATDASRMNLSVSVSGIECHFKASGKNCDHLKMIFFKYIMPNIDE